MPDCSSRPEPCFLIQMTHLHQLIHLEKLEERWEIKSMSASEGVHSCLFISVPVFLFHNPLAQFPKVKNQLCKIVRQAFQA